MVPLAVGILAPSDHFRSWIVGAIAPCQDLVVVASGCSPAVVAPLPPSSSPAVSIIGIAALHETPLAWRLAREVTALWEAVPVIIIGGSPSTAAPDLLLQALYAGVAAWVEHDIAPESLAATVMAVARGAVPLYLQICSQRDLLIAIIEHLRSSVVVVPGPDAFLPLTPHEVAVLDGLVRGLTLKEIAYAGSSHGAARSRQTIKHHVRTIYCKLGAHDRMSVLHAALTYGSITIKAPAYSYQNHRDILHSSSEN